VTSNGPSPALIDHYNHHRYHESFDNLNSADVYFGRGQRTLVRRRQIKLTTIDHRRKLHFAEGA
jgi:putative transposase